MRILLINKYQFLKGGAEHHVFALKELLEKQGHEVAMFGMQHPQNISSPYEKYFVSEVDFARVRFGWQGLRTAARMLWSFEAQRKLSKLIQDFRPDVAHVHNIYHQLSPSVLVTLRKHKIPVVQTVHDYHLISPNYLLYCRGAVCERSAQNPWRAITHRCIKNSYFASTLAAVTFVFHRLLNVYTKNVRTFLTPSNFVREKMVAYGMPAERILHVPNFVDVQRTDVSTERTGVVYVGRLSDEKGVETLVRAAKLLHGPVTVIGTGPQEAALKHLATDIDAANVTFVGQKNSDEVRSALQHAAVVAVPSVCYENYPTVVLEAFAQGTPVVASNIGGIPELVEHQKTGLVIPAGNPSALANELQFVLDNPVIGATLADAAYTKLSALTPTRYYERLMNIYATA